MKSIVSVIVTVLVLLYVAARIVPIDPDEQRPGTLLAGTLMTVDDPNFSFVEDRQKVYVQTNTWYGIAHSVTTIAFAVDGDLYIPCGWCDSKRWPKNVAADPHVVVKIDGRLYPLSAVRIDDEALKRQVLAVPADEPTPDWALYRMDPRS